VLEEKEYSDTHQVVSKMIFVCRFQTKEKGGDRYFVQRQRRDGGRNFGNIKWNQK
jgi:hypothetical protein